MSLSDEEILNHIYEIQQDYWNGDVDANLALSEIRAMFRLRRRTAISSGVAEAWQYKLYPNSELVDSMQYPANKHPDYDGCDCRSTLEHRNTLRAVYGRDCSIPACGCTGDAHP